MRSSAAFALIVAGAGCGRLGFDARGDAAGDELPASSGIGPCRAPTTADDPLSLTGQVIRYVDFQGTSAPVSGATVTASARGGAPLVTTTSDTGGAYALTLGTGGTPVVPVLTVGRAGDIITSLVSDAAMAGPTALDLEITAPGALDAVYQAQFEPDRVPARTAGRGTLLVLARDCAGTNLAGVAVEVSPAPELIAYFNDAGVATSGGTGQKFGRAIGYNAVAGPTRVAASAPGQVFAPVVVDVAAGDAQTVVILHPAE